MKITTRGAVPIAGVLLLAACSGASDAGPAADPPTTGPLATAPAEDVIDEPDENEVAVQEEELGESLPNAQDIVEALADDELMGRDNLTPGSEDAQAILVEVLEQISLPSTADGGYLQAYGEGTNVVGIIPGSGELAEEFVLVGAHYDHEGTECSTFDLPDDNICNGAADNAAGVAVALNVAIDFASTRSPEGGERSMIIAFWDGEEDGLVGSRAYVADPLIPLAQTVVYVNFDIQGANLLPSLANTTILVGAETGGPSLEDAAGAATAASPLDYATFSLFFGQGRSDHAVLVQAGVPAVFFTDGSNGCYHTVLDDVDHLDFPKLDQQIETARVLTRELMVTTTPPVLVTDAPVRSYSDAEQFLGVLQRGEPDLGLVSEDGADVNQFLVDLQAIVEAGPDAYDDAVGGAVLGGAAALLGDFTSSDCTPV